MCDYRLLSPFKFRLWAKIGQKLIKSCHFWKGELNNKNALSKFHILGLYAVYALCAILVLQNLGIGSSLSTIHVWLQASFPLQISVLSQDLPKNVQNDNFWKGKLNKKNSLSKFHIWGLYAVYGLCAILVLQSLGIASSFSTIHVWLQASFPLQISVLSQDLPKTVQNDNFWKGELNQKNSLSKFHIWGLYAVYGLCAILVLQSLGIASSFSTIHVWLQASFPLQISVLSQDLPKPVQNDNFWKGKLNQKSAPSKFHIWGLYAVSVCVPS